MKKQKRILEEIASDMREVKKAIDDKDKEIKILKELVLELRRCNNLLLKENLKFKEVINHKAYLN